MEIHEHAIDRYIQRILGVRLEQVTHQERESYRDVLLKGVNDPDEIYRDTSRIGMMDDDGNQQRYPPIYIKDDFAIPVDWENECIPTTYEADTILDRINGEQSA